MLEQAFHFWPVSIVIGFGLIALVLAIRDYRRDKSVYVAPEKPLVRIVPRFEDDLPCSSIDEIHQKYAEMKETDPKLAGRLMYEEMIRLHGK